MKCTHGGALLLVKLQAQACTFTKCNGPSWVNFMFFEIEQMVTHRKHLQTRAFLMFPVA